MSPLDGAANKPNDNANGNVASEVDYVADVDILAKCLMT